MMHADEPQTLEPVPAAAAQPDNTGQAATWLSWFLRAMAIVSIGKGLYHWAIICGIDAPSPSGFDAYPTAYQIATVFFAVIDPVAGVGLWLAAPWGAVIWLTSIISMAAVEALFPQIYGGNVPVVLIEMALLGIYLLLVLRTARERSE
jgi:hypothetical protein